MSLTEPQGGGGGGGGGSPPVLKPNHDRCIVHLDIDCFYAQVEEVLNPSLRGKPIGIRQKYLLVTCNYTARSLGVRKMEGVAEAKRRCPSLVVMDGEDLTRYREASEAIFSYVAGVCGSMVQRLGMDEIFADVTDLVRRDLRISSSSSSSSGITGHLYSPGSGGKLLEAQTGLEISLDDAGSGGGGAGGHCYLRGTRGSGGGGGDVGGAASGGGDDGEGTGGGNDGIENNRNKDQAFRWGSPSLACDDSQDASQPESQRIAAVASWSNSEGGSVRGKHLGTSQASQGLRCRCGCYERLSAASAFAARVRKGLFEVVGYTCSAGIGCSKMAAKLAGELHKPDQQTTILPEHAMSMVTQLPLRKLPGCGYSTCAKIKTELGITESRQLQAAPWPLLVRTIGLKLARVLFLLCRGEDASPVVPSVRPKTMSDEDSFKRGTVCSRQQVEHHLRRLATPLLLRAGERARAHKEAPGILRFCFRRASKGYGSRVSRQCPISSGVATAWAAAAAAAAAPEGGTGGMGIETGTGVEGGGLTVTMGSGNSRHEQQQQQQQQQQRREKHDAEAERALSEVVRIAMALFDKMVSPGDKLDFTLLSVGFAGFRGLGGGAQSGMSRYFESSPHTGQAESSAGSTSNAGITSSTSCTRTPPTGDVQDYGPTNTSAGATAAPDGSNSGGHASSRLRHDSFGALVLSGTSSSPPTPARSGQAPCHYETPAAVSPAASNPGSSRSAPISTVTARAAAAAAAAAEADASRTSNAAIATPRAAAASSSQCRSNMDEGPSAITAAAAAAAAAAAGAARTRFSVHADSSRPAAVTSAKKRPRDVPRNPYHASNQQQQQQQQQQQASPMKSANAHSGGREEMHQKVAAEAERASATMTQDACKDDAVSEATDAWDGAEIVVVGEGGCAMPGRRKLEWCGPCGAHVLRADMEEHASSTFHRSRLRPRIQE